MRKLLPVVFSSLAVISSGALAADDANSTTSKGSTYQSNENKADPATSHKIESNSSAGGSVKPELGAGPHRDRSAQTSGSGTARDGAPQPVTPSQLPKAGGASTGPSKPDTVEQTEDERKATEAKEKLKKKPGYQDEAPSPRASRTLLVM